MMKPMTAPYRFALALCLAVLTVSAAAQEAAEPTELEGRWVLVLFQVTYPDGEVDEQALPGLEAMEWTFEGRRLTLAVKDEDVMEPLDRAAATFEAAGGTLRISPDDGGEPLDVRYTLEEDTLTLFMDTGEDVTVAAILRRQ